MSNSFLAAYDTAMKSWPVPHEALDISSRFGSTHVIVSGPQNAPALVLLHGYMATSAMWIPNVVDFARGYRTYAVDVMGQPGRSIPGEPIRSAADYVEWFTLTLDALHLDGIHLVGMSFGGWIALAYAIAAPQRVHKLVLLSPGGLLPMSKQFTVGGMLMTLFPTRPTVTWFMRWLGLDDKDFIHLFYLALKCFRMPPETARIWPTAYSDNELRAVQMPTLVLFGDRERIYDPVAALGRARRLMPHVEGDLVPDCSHDMVVSQRRFVDARVLDFLEKPIATPRPRPLQHSSSTATGQLRPLSNPSP